MKKIITIIAVILVVIIVAVAYLWFAGKIFAPVATPTIEPIAVNENNQVVPQQLTYNNEAYNFIFSFPADYSQNDGGNPLRQVGEFFQGSGTELTTVTMPENSYPGSNFYDAFMTVAVQPDSTKKICQQMQQSGATDAATMTETITLNGREFYRGEARDAAAGTFVTDRIYHTFAEGNCYEISLNIFAGNIGNYPEGTVTQVDETAVFAQLQKIAETFEIL